MDKYEKQIKREAIPPEVYVGMARAQMKDDASVVEFCWQLATGWTLEDLKTNKSRKHNVVIVRQLFYFVMRKYTSLTLHQIASYSGQDHATVLNGIRRVNNYLETGDPLTKKYYTKFLVANDTRLFKTIKDGNDESR